MNDEGLERWRAKQLHYQRADVVRDYDATRFASALQRRATERKWRVIEAVLRARGGREPLTVLDVPCGTGRFTARLLGAAARVVNADRSLPMLAAARASVADARATADAPADAPVHAPGAARERVAAPGLLGGVQCDALALPFRDASFDVVLSVRFLFHVPRALRVNVLRELARVSRRHVIVDVRHKYAFATQLKRARARLLRRALPSARMSLAEIDADLAAAGLRLVRRAWIAPPFSEKMLLVCERAAPGGGPLRAS